MSRFLACLLICWLPNAPAAIVHGVTDGNAQQAVRVDTEGGIVTALGECEDDTNNLCRVEHYYSYSADATADAQVKASAGFVHTLSCAGTDAAATAGSVALRDATAAGAGTIVKTIAFAAAFQQPFTLIIDAAFATGIYLDFTTTADVACVVSYR
jgi:hypothetical protein